MALLIEETVDAKGEVTAAVVDAYAARRDQVQTISLGDMAGGLTGAVAATTTVVAGEARTAEIIVDDQVDLEAIVPATWALAGRGWEAVVLIPCHRTGEAHTALRSTPCRLQPWWRDADGIWFGSPETP